MLSKAPTWFIINMLKCQFKPPSSLPRCCQSNRCYIDQHIKYHRVSSDIATVFVCPISCSDEIYFMSFRWYFNHPQYYMLPSDKFDKYIYSSIRKYRSIYQWPWEYCTICKSNVVCSTHTHKHIISIYHMYWTIFLKLCAECRRKFMNYWQNKEKSQTQKHLFDTSFMTLL